MIERFFCFNLIILILILFGFVLILLGFGKQNLIFDFQKILLQLVLNILEGVIILGFFDI
jgi:hypothetical protein